MNTGCLTLGNMGFRVDCTGMSASVGAFCRPADLLACGLYKTQSSCRQNGIVPCNWCVADQQCYYRPSFSPCYQEIPAFAQTIQYPPAVGACPVGTVCNVTNTLRCLAKTQVNCGGSSSLSCGWCANPAQSAYSPAASICALSPPTACSYLGVVNTFPNYCPGVVPTYPPCPNNDMNEATAWCSNKESLEECNFSDDSVWPCQWCSSLGGQPRCMWTPAVSCSYYDPTYGITVIYGGSAAGVPGGLCPVIGGARGIASLVSGWSIVVAFISLLMR